MSQYEESKPPPKYSSRLSRSPLGCPARRTRPVTPVVPAVPSSRLSRSPLGRPGCLGCLGCLGRPGCPAVSVIPPVPPGALRAPIKKNFLASEACKAFYITTFYPIKGQFTIDFLHSPSIEFSQSPQSFAQHPECYKKRFEGNMKRPYPHKSHQKRHNLP